MKNAAQLLEDSLLIIWNDRDSKRRLEAMHSVYAADIHFYESDSSEPITGFERINELITALQSKWAPDFVFSLVRPGQTNHAIQLISWNLGSAGAAPIASGMDVAVIENNRIKSLHLFLEGM